MYQGDPLRAQVSFMKNMFLSYMDRPYFRHYMIEEEYAKSAYSFKSGIPTSAKDSSQYGNGWYFNCTKETGTVTKGDQKTFIFRFREILRTRIKPRKSGYKG